MGGRAVHDGSLVASGEWRELPLFGSQRRCVGCAACPATAALVEGSIPAAFDLAMAGGGETLFSKPNASPSPSLTLTLTLALTLTLTRRDPLLCAPPRHPPAPALRIHQQVSLTLTLTLTLT